MNGLPKQFFFVIMTIRHSTLMDMCILYEQNMTEGGMVLDAIKHADTVVIKSNAPMSKELALPDVMLVLKGINVKHVSIHAYATLTAQ